MMQEVGTSTGDVAGFKRVALPTKRRDWPYDKPARDIAMGMTKNLDDYMAEFTPKHGKEKKPHWQPQVKE